LIALSIACATFDRHLQIGDVLDRMDSLLKAHADASDDTDILIDEVAAGLLDARFQVVRTSAGSYRLRGLRHDVDASRPLLGKPTPCVGRDFDVSTLEMQLTQSIEEPGSRAVVVLGAPGIGKTRLRQEFLRRIRSGLAAQGFSDEILLARASDQTTRSPYGLIATALRHFCGVDGIPQEEVRRQVLLEQLGRRLTTIEVTARARILEFVSELCELPAVKEVSPLLARARGDVKLMQHEIEKAFCEFVAALSAHHPVLLVFDDFHWADAQSVELIGLALKQLKSQPVLVVAFSRPELSERYPRLWEGSIQQLWLGGLTRKSSERLVREILGPDVPADAVARMVEQAAGNPLFLEELIRAYAEGKQLSVPDTVMAMLQARLGRLPANTRRVLRAASVFGLSFWKGGVSAVVGPAYLPGELTQHLEELVQSEVCEKRRLSRYPDDTEYCFHHALVRDAAYSLLTDADRALGHRLAGRFLSRVGERDPIILIDHFTRGDDLEHAAKQRLRAGDNALRLCSRQEARMHYATAAELAEKLGQNLAHRRLLADALLRFVQSSFELNQPDENLKQLRLAEAALNPRPDETPSANPAEQEQADYRFARLHYLWGRTLLYAGENQEAMRHYAIALPIAQRLGRPELIAQPASLQGYALLTQGNYRLAMPYLLQAKDAFDQINEPFEGMMLRGSYALCLLALGETTMATAEFAAVEQQALSSQQPRALAQYRTNRMGLYLWLGDTPSLVKEGPEAIEAVLRSGDQVLRYFAYLIVGQGMTQVGDFATARHHFQCCADIVQETGGQILMIDQLELAQAELLLAEGQLAAALAQAQRICEMARPLDLLFTLGGAERCCARALSALAPSASTEIDGHMERSIAAYERGGIVLERARSHLHWALILRARGDAERAATLFQAARTRFQISHCVYALSKAERLWQGMSEGP
jgi:tetratricopeptide (TPR) repeat protein